jgi:uracil-DNA glycosylase family 4
MGDAQRVDLRCPVLYTRPMLDRDTAADLALVLAWYREMGVDAAVGNEAIDWLSRGDRGPGADFVTPSADAGPAQPAARSSATPQPQGRSQFSQPLERRPPPLPPQRKITVSEPDAAVSAARAAVKSARTLQELEAILARFDGCTLKATAKNLCFYRGAEKARLMIIGEAPGREEDQAGKPFVGRAGQLLDKMLAAIGLGEADAHITNVVYWRPPGNRTPTPLEAQVCRPFLERQVELVAPDLVLLLGGAAAKHIFDVPEGIMRIRGKLRDVEIGAHATKGLATLHPAYLLRTPIAKRMAWRDLLLARQALAKSVH